MDNEHDQSAGDESPAVLKPIFLQNCGRLEILSEIEYKVYRKSVRTIFEKAIRVFTGTRDIWWHCQFGVFIERCGSAWVLHTPESQIYKLGLGGNKGLLNGKDWRNQDSIKDFNTFFTADLSIPAYLVYRRLRADGWIVKRKNEKLFLRDARRQIVQTDTDSQTDDDSQSCEDFSPQNPLREIDAESDGYLDLQMIPRIDTIHPNFRWIIKKSQHAREQLEVAICRGSDNLTDYLSSSESPDIIAVINSTLVAFLRIEDVSWDFAVAKSVKIQQTTEVD